MDDSKLKIVGSWLEKAGRDLDAARKLASPPDPQFDTAVFHCQQAAEKAIKGFLVFHDRRFSKIHDLEVLVDLATEFEAGFQSWLDAADDLTPYATIYRYPGDIDAPEPSEFDDALKNAEGIYTFVVSLLPGEWKSG